MSACARLQQQLSHLSNPSELTSEACCAVPASADFKATSNYAGKGKMVDVANFKAYVTGKGDKAGVVIIPDAMDGAWSIEKFPPKTDAERNAMFGHITRAGSWPKVVKPRLLETVKYLKAQGVTSIGACGFCWGSKMCMLTIADPAFADVKGVALFHPSMLENGDAEKAAKPAAIFPSKDEPDLTKFYEILRSKAPATIHKRYDQSPHGWVGATANFSNPIEKRDADDVIDLAAGWFGKLH